MSVFTKEFKHLSIAVADIISATNNFDDDNLLGRGGFGKVYKGELPQSDQNTTCTVAVKRLDRQLGQGDPEFRKEIMVLSDYQHKNIVSLKGFCDEKGERILVYEFASRGSLDKNIASADLDWIQRLNICLGVASGLEYLHYPEGKLQRVLHRDIKSSNILLDENWTPKISDFGLSRLGFANQPNSFIVTGAVGTREYCDPIYAEENILRKESDVYSFGVVMFEVLFGRLSFIRSNESFADLARYYFENKKHNEIVYDGIKNEINPDSLNVFATVACRCLKKACEDRPTMTEVVKHLKFAIRLQLNTYTPLEAALWDDLGGLNRQTVRYDFGKLLFGCKHHRSRCKLRAPCCNRIFPCALCHDEYTSQLQNPDKRHKMVSRDVNQVICTICHARQPAVQICCNCGAKMGEYFCKVCKLYDDDTSKGQFHCDDCGICRHGGHEKSIHCHDCGCCHAKSHTCLQNPLRKDCPVCHENLFDYSKKVIILLCRHAMHVDCFPEISRSNGCPICLNSSTSTDKVLLLEK